MNNVYKCKGEPNISLILGLMSVVFLSAIGIGFVFIWNLASILTGFFLVLLSFYLVSRWEKEVLFTENGVSVEYYFGRRKTIPFSACKKLYKSNDGIIPAPINVIKYKLNQNERKITFVCDDAMLQEICDEYFNSFVPKNHNE